MNKLVKTSVICAVLVSALAACEVGKKETEATVEPPTPKHTASVKNTPVVKPAEGSLSYREKSKHDKYYISTNSASYLEDIDSVNGTSTFLNVSVRLENTFDEGNSVSIKDLHFTLEDLTAKKTYEPTSREAYTKDAKTVRTTDYPNKMLNDKPLDLDILFNIPNKPDHLYQLMVIQDATDADYFYLDNIKPLIK